MLRHALIVSFAVGMLAITSAAQAAPAVPAKAFVDSVGSQALGTLQDKKLTEAQKFSTLEDLFRKSVDIPYVGKFVLGRYWRTATPVQQQRYMKAYEPFLIKNYVSRVVRYSGQTYKLGEAKPMDDGGATVAMTLHTPDGSAPDVLVNYRLSKVGTGYKVIDIMVEGVSLLNTQRSEFSSVVSNKGLDGLIAALEKRAK